MRQTLMSTQKPVPTHFKDMSLEYAESGHSGPCRRRQDQPDRAAALRRRFIDALGSVDAGNTQTDSLALERQRGITIKSAVASFTDRRCRGEPDRHSGHPDFIAEVERVLSVLDGAILVISAVEGVQAQTRVLMRALQRLRIPTMIFVNKIDRNRRAYEQT